MVGDVVGGDVLSAVVGVVDWLERGTCGGVWRWGGGGGPVGGWLLGVVLIKVAVRRCRM